MGSWFGTCGVSQLPIQFADEIAIVLMKREEYGEENPSCCGYVHSSALFSPIAPAFFGKYADYGRVSDIECDSRIIESVYGEMMDKDAETTINEKSESEGVFWFYIHKQIYLDVIEHFGKLRDFYTKGKDLKHYLREDLVKYLKSSKGSSNIPEIELSRSITHRKLKYSKGYYLKCQHYYDIENDSLVDSIVDLLILEDAMEKSRKIWTPQSGQGSQYYNMTVAEIVGRFATRRSCES